MQGIVRKAGNRLRQDNEKLLLILLKLSRKLGGFHKLKGYGLTDEEIGFLKGEFPNKE